MAEIFSDIDRCSPAWQSPSLMPVQAPPPPAQHTTEFQQQHLQHPHPHPHHHLHHQPPQYTPNGSYSSSVRPQVQSGWFPLQDTGGSSTDQVLSRPHDMYADTMMPSPAQRQQSMQQHQQQWPSGDSSPYMGNDTPRLGNVPGFPRQQETSGYSPSMYAQGYHTPVQDVHTSSGFGWQDARPMPPPPIHTTGLEHVRAMNVPGGPYEDMHRVHQAAQGMHAMMGGMASMHRDPSMQHAGAYMTQPRKFKSQKDISIGRWTSDEHRVFLKGLEMYQGPAWGEIARMIGTRTSTQVRTHAQKFFTKLARSNQMLPYFEPQIQRERTRLLSQGAMLSSSHSTVTPTSTSAAHHFTFSTLSPPRKREYPGHPRMATAYDDHMHGSTLRPPAAASPYVAADQSTPPLDIYKHRLDGGTPPELGGGGLRKLRLGGMEYPSLGSDPAASPYGEPQHQMMAYSTSADSYRDPVGYPNTMNSQVQGDWNDVVSSTRPWAGSGNNANADLDPTHPSNSSTDPDSLPSVTRLLYRGMSG